MVKTIRDKIAEASSFVETYVKRSPEVGIILGTGLGGLSEKIQIDASIAYRKIPHFPVSTVQSHDGRLVMGRLSGKAIMAMQGRFHLYEGYTAQEVSFPVRMMQSFGIKTLIVSNAAGGINPLFASGDMMLIADHINLTGENPLIGPNVDEWGSRFPDMSQVYDRDLMALAGDAALKTGIPIQKGIYAGLRGPSLETPSEVRFLKIIGADAVGFSTVCEVIAAVHAGMRVLGISIITNINLPDHPVPAFIDEIIAIAQKQAPVLESIVTEVLRAM
jgi:purine-nucleoside phosphorylase